ncbi:caprin-2 isoform X4 [Gadus macrocephalus]|uniref:caprin-2 isoform X4 n=1 Tax=Gadus macrocephalus TaxID=80720 RepID=UPI0028CB9A4F|nr:caprin-2 isoform X4 [Gadus macrocephalus]
MVQLSPSPTRLVGSAAGCPVVGDPPETYSPKTGSPGSLSPLHLHLEVSTAYQGYDNYIEDGLICLKHKIRNMDKRKLKLEHYMKWVENGGTLNKDQMDAVGQYQELIHNLAFAQEMHCSLDVLTQSLLRAQKKAAEKEQQERVEEERRRLSTVLRFQHLLASLQQEQTQGDLLEGRGQAPRVSPQRLDSLTQLSGLLGLGQRDSLLSVAKQMEKAALLYFDLLEAKHTPVAGSTFKDLKEQLTSFLDCEYFKVLRPLPPPSRAPVVIPSPPIHTIISQPKTKETPKSKPVSRPRITVTQTAPPPPPHPNLKAEFLAMKEREPPDSWDVEFLSDRPLTPKPSKGAATFIPRGAEPKPLPIRPKRKKGKKAKGSQSVKLAAIVVAPLEVFNSQAVLPNDPVLRKQQLEVLLHKIHGSFSFMQESHLDPEGFPIDGHARLGCRASGSPPLLGSSHTLGCPSDSVSHLSHSLTPFSATEAKQELIKSPMELIKSPMELIKSPMELIKSPMELIKSPMELIKSPMELIKSPMELIKSPIEVIKSPIEVLPEMMQSTPLPARRLEGRASLTNGEQALNLCDLSFPARDVSNESLQLDVQTLVSPPLVSPTLVSPPLYRRDSVNSVSPENRSLPRTPVMDSGKQSPCNGVSSPSVTPQGHSFSTPPARRALIADQFQSVFKLTGSESPTGELGYETETSYNTASTQTPPEFAPSDDEPQSAYQSDCPVDGGGQVFLSPSQPSAGRAYHGRGYARGPAFVQGVPHRDPGPLLYGARESVFQHGYRRGGAARHNSSGWSDSSQVSSPDRDGVYPLLDSGHGDSLSVSTLEVPVTPHHHHHHHHHPQQQQHHPHTHPQHQPTLLPVPMYPLTQPIRVAFTASRTANFAPGNLDQTVVFDQLHTNVGETYDARVGRFTCPVAGAYVFLFHILKLAINVPLYVNLMCNDEVMVSAYANDGAPDHETASNHAILPLYPGDQVWLRLHRGAIYGSTWKYSTFSGFLLYQD